MNTNDLPKDEWLLLGFKGIPFPVVGLRHQKFDYKLVLALPSFKLRPEVANSFIEVDPYGYSLTPPPKQWEVQSFKVYGKENN